LGDQDRSGLANEIRRDHGEQAGVTGALVRQGVGKRDANWSGLIADQKVDVGYLVAVADQGFTNEHGHGETPWKWCRTPRGASLTGDTISVGRAGGKRFPGAVAPGR